MFTLACISSDSTPTEAVESTLGKINSCIIRIIISKPLFLTILPFALLFYSLLSYLLQNITNVSILFFPNNTNHNSILPTLFLNSLILYCSNMQLTTIQLITKVKELQILHQRHSPFF